MFPNAIGAFADSLKSLTQQLGSLVVGIAGLNSVAKGLSPVWKALTADVASFGGALRNLSEAVAGGAVKVAAGLAALGAAAAPGGLEVFGQIITYLTTVIGSVATPVFALLAAGVLTVVDLYRGDLLNATKAVAKYLAENLGPAIDAVVTGILNFVDIVKAGAITLRLGIVTAVEAIAKAINWVLDKIPGVGRSQTLDNVAEGFGEQRREDMDTLGQISRGYFRRNEERDQRRAAGQPGGAGQGFMDKLTGNLGSVLKGMQQAIGQKGNVGFSGLADVARTVQQQAFQNDIQGRTLQAQLESLGVLKDMLKELKRPDAAAIGA